MKIIGLTGGIASGKSTVSKIIEAQGIPVICADKTAHIAMEPQNAVYPKIVEYFGDEILSVDKTINRTKLGAIVFHDKMKLEILNSLIHPEVKRMIKREILIFKKQKHKMIVLDVPLLFETGFDTLCDEILVVYTPEHVMKERHQKRNPELSFTEIEKRILAQMPIEEKKKLADHVIDNTASIDETKKQIDIWLSR